MEVTFIDKSNPDYELTLWDIMGKAKNLDSEDCAHMLHNLLSVLLVSNTITESDLLEICDCRWASVLIDETDTAKE